jgi:hypothetical protein
VLGPTLGAGHPASSCRPAEQVMTDAHLSRAATARSICSVLFDVVETAIHALD